MPFYILRFLIIFALWWVALWLALPVEWIQQGSLPSLAMLHVGPPSFAMAFWLFGKRTLRWRKAKVKKRAANADAAVKEGQLAATKAAHQETLDRLRAHVECRAVWAELVRIPDYLAETTERCVLLKLPEELQGSGRETVLTSSLERVFEVALSQCEASVWLPVVIIDGSPIQREWVVRAWHHAVTACGIKQSPQSPDCIILPDSREMVDRIVALFDKDPVLPAVILVGMDSPVADDMAGAEDFGDEANEPGHVVTAMLLNRPGLTAPGNTQNSTLGREDDDPYMPYWERKHKYDDSPQWGRIPPQLRLDFWDIPPLVMLYRSSSVNGLEQKRSSVLTRQIQDVIAKAFIHAGLRDLPLATEEGAKTDAADESELPEFGWLVHNAPPIRLGALFCALRDSGCEIDPFVESVKLEKEHGNVGSAHSVMMLTGALIRAAQLQKPVLIAGFNEDNSLDISLVRPFAKNMPTNTA